MPNEHDRALREELNNLLSECLHGHGDLVTRWVLLIEVVDQEGRRAMWNLASPDMKSWDALGMLTYATQIEQAGTVEEVLGEQ